MISREQVSRLVYDKESMHDAMVRNGYVLPEKRQGICTLDFMLRVRNEEIWVPRKNQCSVYTKVVQPPPRQQLAQIIREIITQITLSGEHPDHEMEKFLVLSEIVLKKLADTPWLIQLIHCLRPGHEIFNKNYFYVKPRKQQAIAQLPLLNNKDGFFDNLPEVPLKGKKGCSRFLRLTKAERKKMQVRALELKKQEIEDRLNGMRNELIDAEVEEEEEEKEPLPDNEEMKQAVQEAQLEDLVQEIQPNSQVVVGSPEPLVYQDELEQSVHSNNIDQQQQHMQQQQNQMSISQTVKNRRRNKQTPVLTQMVAIEDEQQVSQWANVQNGIKNIRMQ